jgi:Rod binding domain-containing protein
MFDPLRTHGEFMAIDASSDIVLEVANAADPTRAAAVAQRLNALSGATGAADAADFADALAATAPAAASGPSTAPAAASGPSAADARARFSAAAEAADGKAAKVKTEFESVMLNSFVSEMLPKDASTVFGQGLAGDMWKSMLADQVSRQIAKSDALGIGKRLFATHPLAASDALEKAKRADSAAAASTAQMSANSLALPSGVEVNDGAVLFAAEKRS